MSAFPVDTTILIFAKAPVPGFAKTRLIPLLGAQGAAELARQMLKRTCSEALRVPGATAELCATPVAADPAWRGRMPKRVSVSDQGEGDLGERLARACERSLSQSDGAILIGADCPAIDRYRLAFAAQALRNHDAFIHPAADGGYALLALRRFSPLLFADIPWSSSDVCRITLRALCRLGWTVSVGETLRDVDEPADALDCFGLEALAALASDRAGSR